jgi:hypothetical protein
MPITGAEGRLEKVGGAPGDSRRKVVQHLGVGPMSTMLSGLPCRTPINGTEGKEGSSMRWRIRLALCLDPRAGVLASA